MRSNWWSTTESPIGTLVLTASGDSLTGLYMEVPPRPLIDHVRDAKPFEAVRDQLDAYWARERTTFDIPLAPSGTPFQLTVWNELATIPYGTTTSYGDIARRIGRASAPRAVGLANGRNPISIIVPCHRVIGSSGSLVGYGGGLERKRWLLELENAPE